jgi:hypothetical protein
MARSFRELSAALDLCRDPFLDLFEAHCAAMRANTRVLEWSCKLRGRELNGARFLHTALLPDFRQSVNALDALLTGLAPMRGVGKEEADLFKGLRRVAEAVGEGVAVGYAGHPPTGSGQAEIKLYITTSRLPEILRLAAGWFPEGAVLPPELSKVMIAASLNSNLRQHPRYYYLWNFESADQRRTLDWLSEHCTAEEIRLIESSGARTISLSFKKGARDMIYLSAPFRQPELNDLLLARLRHHPVVLAEIPDLRWVGFSKFGEGLDGRELNLYFNSYLD